MAQLANLKVERKAALDAAEALIRKGESSGALTPAESSQLDAHMLNVETINSKIKLIESQNTIRTMINPQGVLLTDAPKGVEGRPFAKPERRVFSEEYPGSFYTYVQSGGKRMEAALYEGSSPAGGYAVPIVVDDQIVPLAPKEMSIRELATVIPTVADLKLPVKGSFGVASAKAENASFAEVDPTLSQVTLSAFMSGIQETISWELAQDVPAFNAFCVQDMILAQQMYEENKYINGSGSGEPQGLIGNVGAGVTEEPDSNGNLVSIAGILDLIGTLNALYHPGAAFLMSRLTSIIIRKAQVESNLYNPAWTRVGTQDYLFGYPVSYSSSMPAASRGACPVLFGDFKRGFVIGDRGGAGINVKVLDQPAAQQGQIILLAYRRSDSRVRRSEAIQAYNVASS